MIHQSHNISTREVPAGWEPAVVEYCTRCGKSGVELRQECSHAKITDASTRAVWSVLTPPQMGGPR